MSTSTTTSEDDPEELTAEQLYDEFRSQVNEYAQRDDEIGAMARAIKRVGGDDDGE